MIIFLFAQKVPIHSLKILITVYNGVDRNEGQVVERPLCCKRVPLLACG